MSEMLLKHNLKTLRLPTMLAEYAKLSREAADVGEGHEQYLLRLTELEVATRSANALATRSDLHRLHLFRPPIPLHTNCAVMNRAIDIRRNAPKH